MKTVGQKCGALPAISEPRIGCEYGGHDGNTPQRKTAKFAVAAGSPFYPVTNKAASTALRVPRRRFEEYLHQNPI
jgi:hypothetical protein